MEQNETTDTYASVADLKNCGVPDLTRADLAANQEA